MRVLRRKDDPRSTPEKERRRDVGGVVGCGTLGVSCTASVVHGTCEGTSRLRRAVTT